MQVTNETIQREVRMMSNGLLDMIVASEHRKWRGYKHAVRAELVRRTKVWRGEA